MLYGQAAAVAPALNRFAAKAHMVILKDGVAFLLSLLVAAVDFGMAQDSRLPASDSDQYRISVNVDLVMLPVTVVDAHGAFVSGLAKDDFRVVENGVPQEIRLFRHEDVPVTAGLVVDSSGSMWSKLPEVGAAALTFARSSNKEDEMFVVDFNEKVALALPEGVPFTDQVDQLKGAFSRIRAVGKTALYDAVAVALEQLKKGHWDKKILLVVSDGGDNASHLTQNEMMTLAENSNAIIYTIGIFDDNDPDRNPRALGQLAKMTGGIAFFPETVANVESVCQQIAKDIRNQYSIGYVPANRKMDGTYRSVRVTASAPDHRKLIVRTRAGYRATLQAQSTISPDDNLKP